MHIQMSFSLHIHAAHREAVENSGQEIADTEKRKAETSIEAVPAEN